MAGFFESFRNMFKIQELRQRILFTIGLLVLARFGAHVTLPGVDAAVLSAAENAGSATGLLGMFDLFVGGAFSKAAIFSLGIMPYISASIVIQLHRLHHHSAAGCGGSLLPETAEGGRGRRPEKD